MNKYQPYSRLTLKTGPATEPITLNEVKAYLGIGDSFSDTAITSWIASTRQLIELYTGLALISQTWKLYFDGFPGVNSNWIVPYCPISIELPKAPLVSVTSIKTYDISDVATTISASYYQVSAYTAVNPFEGRIAFKDSFQAPTVTALRNIDSTEVEFIAGYGAAAAVPDAIKNAMLQEIGFRNMNKQGVALESESVDGVWSGKYSTTAKTSKSGLSETTMALLSPFRKLRI